MLTAWNYVIGYRKLSQFFDYYLLHYFIAHRCQSYLATFFEDRDGNTFFPSGWILNLRSNAGSEDVYSLV